MNKPEPDNAEAVPNHKSGLSLNGLPAEPELRRRHRRRRSSQQSTISNSDTEEESSSVHEELAPAPTAPSMPAWASFLAVLFPLAYCFLGARYDTWVLAASAAAIGLFCILFPPKGKIPFRVLMPLAGILGFSLLSVVPLPWPSWPEWRTPLKQDFGIDVGSAWSAQPLVTLECCVQQAIMMLWFLWWVGRKMTLDERRSSLRWLCLGLSTLGVLAIVFRISHTEPLLWKHVDGEDDFGPLDNRNHFAGLMAICSVLALGTAHDALKKRSRCWWLLALALLPAFAAIILNTSRAGILLFFTGLVVWFFTHSLKRRSIKKMALGLALLLVALAVLSTTGKHIIDHFRPMRGGDITLTSALDGRSQIYAEALKLSADHPGLGVGLGNFETIFSMTNKLESDYLGFSHPESDLLWFMCEAGWPATLCLLVLLVLLLAWTGPWFYRSKQEERGERRLRITAFIGCLLALLHGIFDTPNHSNAFLCTLLALAGLSLRQRRIQMHAGISSPWTFRLLGLGCWAAASVWWMTHQGQVTVFGESTADEQLRLAERNLAEGRPEQAVACTLAASKAAPISWPSYFMRAHTLLTMNRPATEALTEFSRVRYLEQYVTFPLLDEAQIWLKYQPAYAIPVWRETLNRCRRLLLNRYEHICTHLYAHPQLAPSIRGLARTPVLKLKYIEMVAKHTKNKEEIQAGLRDLLEANPSLDALNAQQRKQAFLYWQEFGDAQDLLRQLERHPDWISTAWFVKSEQMAQQGKHEEAFRFAARFATPSALAIPSRDVSELQRSFALNPTDMSIGIDLYAAQKFRKLYAEGAFTLGKLKALPNPPKYLLREMADISNELGEHAQAWEYMRQYVRESEGL